MNGWLGKWWMRRFSRHKLAEKMYKNVKFYMLSIVKKREIK
jgi:uncharacterized membrane protein YsdA (DUF1294 family)